MKPFENQPMKWHKKTQEGETMKKSSDVTLIGNWPGVRGASEGRTGGPRRGNELRRRARHYLVAGREL